jgi:hypothetical protein
MDFKLYGISKYSWWFQNSHKWHRINKTNLSYYLVVKECKSGAKKTFDSTKPSKTQTPWISRQANGITRTVRPVRASKTTKPSLATGTNTISLKMQNESTCSSIFFRHSLVLVAVSNAIRVATLAPTTMAPSDATAREETRPIRFA